MPEVNETQKKNLGELFPITAGYSVQDVLGELHQRISYHAGSPMGVGDHTVQSIDGQAGPIIAEHIVDAHGNPAGGYIAGKGFVIAFQQGPLGRGEEREAPNGAFVEDVIEAALLRMRFYQDSKFKCRENALTITDLESAQNWMIRRTSERERRDVEGTYSK